MKRTFVFMMISAVFMLSGCNKESEMHNGYITLRATQNSSRASFNGSATVWEEGDELKVTFTDAGSTQQLIFATNNPLQGIFTSTTSAQLMQKSYEVLATYPAATTSIDASNKSAEVTVGAATQTQQGSSTSHIAALDAMYGSTTALPDNVSIKMDHTASVVKLDIVNTTGSDISAIEQVTIIAPQGISLSGARTVDFSSGEITGNEGSNTIVVNIEDGSAVTSSTPFTVWAATAPFNIAAGQILKFIVKADGKSYEIIKDFNGAKCDFEAGVIMETTLELSAATLMASEKSVTATFSNENGYPDGFPDKNATSAIDGTYKFGDYYYAFAGNVNMYYSNGGLRINLQKSNDYGTIALPVIEGYALTKVIVKLRDTYSGRLYKIAITDGELTPVEGGQAKAILSQSMTYNLTGLNPATQYYLHAYVTTIADKQPCDITSVELTYSLQ